MQVTSGYACVVSDLRQAREIEAGLRVKLAEALTENESLRGELERQAEAARTNEDGLLHAVAERVTEIERLHEAARVNERVICMLGEDGGRLRAAVGALEDDLAKTSAERDGLAEENAALKQAIDAAREVSWRAQQQAGTSVDALTVEHYPSAAVGASGEAA